MELTSLGYPLEYPPSRSLRLRVHVPWHAELSYSKWSLYPFSLQPSVECWTHHQAIFATFYGTTNIPRLLLGRAANLAIFRVAFIQVDEQTLGVISCTSVCETILKYLVVAWGLLLSCG